MALKGLLEQNKYQKKPILINDLKSIINAIDEFNKI